MLNRQIPYPGVPFANMTALMEARSLVKHYGSVEAVRGVDLILQEGTCLGLLGPNGAGKSTTIEMLEGIKPPTSGTVLFRGHPLDAQFKQRAGIQFQSTSIQDYLQVGEVLKLFSHLYDKTRPIEELVRRCSLEEFMDRDVHKLSGGQRQRVMLALALLNDPDVVFLDEPTTGLDPQARRNFWELIRGIQDEGKTILLTTHYMEEAYSLCDDIAIMDHGQVIAQGTPEALLKKHFDGVTMEIPVSDMATLPAGVHGQAARRGDTWLIRSTDPEATFKGLLGNHVPLRNLTVRSQTLEDLFLELTGKELRE